MRKFSGSAPLDDFGAVTNKKENQTFCRYLNGYFYHSKETAIRKENLKFMS